jgi:hypothetical protein
MQENESHHREAYVCYLEEVSNGGIANDVTLKKQPRHCGSGLVRFNLIAHYAMGKE